MGLLPSFLCMLTGWDEFFLPCQSLASVTCALLPVSRKVVFLALVTRRQATLNTAQGSKGNAGWMSWDPTKFQRGVAQADPTSLAFDILEKLQQQGGLPLPIVGLAFLGMKAYEHPYPKTQMSHKCSPRLESRVENWGGGAS